MALRGKGSLRDQYNLPQRRGGTGGEISDVISGDDIWRGFSQIFGCLPHILQLLSEAYVFYLFFQKRLPYVNLCSMSLCGMYS